MNTINCTWCTPSDTPSLDKLVELFVSNACNQYISHGEVIDGRANNMHEWKGNIKEIMTGEFSAALHSDFDCPDIFTKLAIARRDDAVIALALVQFYPETKIAMLCDIVVDAPLRGQKIGEAMLGWIETEVKAWGAKFIFLESGKHNHSAHRFFEQAGFQGVSIVMAKNV